MWAFWQLHVLADYRDEQDQRIKDAALMASGVAVGVHDPKQIASVFSTTPDVNVDTLDDDARAEVVAADGTPTGGLFRDTGGDAAMADWLEQARGRFDEKTREAEEG